MKTESYYADIIGANAERANKRIAVVAVLLAVVNAGLACLLAMKSSRQS